MFRTLQRNVPSAGIERLYAFDKPSNLSSEVLPKT